ncbi:MAG TPA: histidine--tRNA ligase [Actinomycetota bacterium]|jgi:histidyl-tRNA synthetase|nr:histidine--tRNA ligase [Actinomycetota bacterium]
MDLKPPRGTQDFVPPEGSGLRALYDRAADVARRFGYRYVETPTFEHTELFARTSGQTSDVVSKEMYTFVDRGDRSLTLRPEGTAPVVRAFLEHRHDLPSPFKAYYLTRMFRYDRPQAGRYREHRQFGVEAIDAPEPAVDVEVITLGDAYLRSFGLARYELQINSIGDEVCRPAYRDLLVAYLAANHERLRDEHRDRFEDNPMRVLDCKDEACRAVAADAPRIIDHLCDPCREHLEGVLDGLRAEGLKPQIVPTLVRGLDYYTRTAFEFVSEVSSLAQAGTLFGGGRYDGLAEALGGPHVPGVGFGMGLERVLIALRDEGIEPPREPDLDVFVVGVGESGRSAASDLVRLLRGAGVPAAAAFAERPLKAQLKMADRAGARFAAIVGDAEAESGTVTLKHLADGAQQTIGAADVVDRVRAGT